MVASRPILAGEAIIFEEPAALVKAGEVPEGCPASATPEWLLVRKLLQQGKRASWATTGYVCKVLHATEGKPEVDELVGWILGTVGSYLSPFPCLP
jgi:hypothetical protein